MRRPVARQEPQGHACDPGACFLSSLCLGAFVSSCWMAEEVAGVSQGGEAGVHGRLLDGCVEVEGGDEAGDQSVLHLAEGQGAAEKIL